MPSPPVLEYRAPQKVVRDMPPLHGIESVYHGAVGIVIPALCFMASIPRYPPGPLDVPKGPESYVAMIPTLACGWPFFPLLGFAMRGGMAQMLADPLAAAKRVLVQVALWSGGVLAVQYTCIHAIVLCGVSDQRLAAAISIGVGVAVTVFFGIFAFRWLANHTRVVEILIVLGTIGTLVCVMWIGAAGLVLPLLGLAVFLVFIPAITLASYLWMAWYADQLRRDFWDSRTPWIVGFYWLGAYALAICISAFCVLNLHGKLLR